MQKEPIMAVHPLLSYKVGRHRKHPALQLIYPQGLVCGRRANLNEINMSFLLIIIGPYKQHSLNA